MNAVRERDVLSQCLDLLRILCVPAWRTNSGGMRAGKRYVRFNGADGCSDIIGLCPRLGGRLLAVECKRPGEKLRANQAGFLDAVRAAGGLALVVSDVRQLESALRAEGVI